MSSKYFEINKLRFVGLLQTIDKTRNEQQCECFNNNDLLCEVNCINKQDLWQCNKFICSNDSNKCHNKYFDRKIKHEFVKFFVNKEIGYGLYTKNLIECGEFVMEYVGEVIDAEEQERREKKYKNQKKQHRYFIDYFNGIVIDSCIYGNLSRFINHSCEPNVESQQWTVNGKIRIGIFAIKTINKGEELSMKYLKDLEQNCCCKKCIAINENK